MKFLNKIKDRSDKELRKIVGDRIIYLERKAKRLNPDYSFLGCDVGLNYEPHELLRSHSKYNEYGVRVAAFYNSFIGHDMKVIFGTSYREDGSMANLGMYYYADNQDYLYDFCKYV